MISLDKLEDVITLVGVVGGLHMIAGYESRSRVRISEELTGKPQAPKV